MAQKITKIPKPVPLKTQCDKLWAEIIKARAGYQSEISGKTKGLNAHHIAGKPNLKLRYDFDNGICITGGEHIFGIHHAGREQEYREKIKRVRGADIYERLSRFSKGSYKIDLKMMKIYLTAELKKLNGLNK